MLSDWISVFLLLPSLLFVLGVRHHLPMNPDLTLIQLLFLNHCLSPICKLILECRVCHRL